MRIKAQSNTKKLFVGRGAGLACAAALLCAVPILGQFSGRIQGSVTDSSGAAIPYAKVVITNLENNITQTVQTNGAGEYRLNSLSPGNYRVHVEATGFAQRDVNTNVGTQEDAGVNVTLGVQNSSSSIDVTATASGYNPEETRIQATIDTQQVRDLPLAGRGTLNLVNTAPGVSGYSEGLNNFAVEQTPQASANGHYFGGNLYVLDGIIITSNITTGTANISPNADAVREVTLQPNNFSLDYASGSGLTTELTTKSGTNQFHGTGNATYTDQDMRAPGYFKSNSRFNTKDFAATFGGPIVRDHTFVFAQFEKLVQASASTSQFPVESAAFLNYAKSAFPNSTGTKLLTSYAVTNAQRNGVRLYATPDFTTTCITPTGNCTTPFVESATTSNSPYRRGLQYSFRGDQYLNGGKDRIYGYYFKFHLDSQAIDNRPGFTTVNPNDSYLYSVNYTHTFSDRLVNEAQFGAYKVYGASPAADPKVPFININGQQNVTSFGGGWGPGNFTQHNYSWRDVASYVRGNHNIRAGFRVTHGDDSADFGGVNARPTFSFNSLTDFVQDRVFDESSVSFDPLTGKFKPLQFGVQGTDYGIFVDDTWKVRRNLTLTFGGRFDNFGNPYTYGYQSYTKIANLVPTGNTGLNLTGNLNDQIANASIRQTEKVFSSSRKGFTPRASFAWQPWQNGHTSLHGGIGLYRDQITLGQVVDGLRGNPPGWVYPYFSPTQPIQPVYSFGTSNTLPYGYTYPTIPATGLDSKGGVPGLNAGVSGLDPNIKIPKTLNMTVGISQELPARIVISVNGVGSYAWDQLSGTDFNRFAGDLLDGKQDRLNSSFGSITYVTNLNRANYAGLIFTMSQSAGNFNYQTSYTWSHALDNGTCGTRFDFNASTDCPADQHNFAANYGNSAFDVTNNFKFSGSYTIPSPHIQAVADRLLGGWEVSSIAVAQSGIPFSAVNLNPYTPGCSTVVCGDYNADGYNNDRPNILPGVKTKGFSRREYLNGILPGGVATAFTRPGVFSLSNQGRNVFRNPGVFNIDASALKNTKLPWFHTETSNLQLRVDFFNVLNRTNLNTVDYNVGSSTFGQSTSTRQSRFFQIGARFLF